MRSCRVLLVAFSFGMGSCKRIKPREKPKTTDATPSKDSGAEEEHRPYVKEMPSYTSAADISKAINAVATADNQSLAETSCTDCENNFDCRCVGGSVKCYCNDVIKELGWYVEWSRRGRTTKLECQNLLVGKESDKWVSQGGKRPMKEVKGVPNFADTILGCRNGATRITQLNYGDPNINDILHDIDTSVRLEPRWFNPTTEDVSITDARFILKGGKHDGGTMETAAWKGKGVKVVHSKFDNTPDCTSMKRYYDYGMKLEATEEGETKSGTGVTKKKYCSWSQMPMLHNQNKKGIVGFVQCRCRKRWFQNERTCKADDAQKKAKVPDYTANVPCVAPSSL